MTTSAPVASTSASASSASQVAGTWNGTFASKKYPSTTGTFIVVFRQQGTPIAGTITVTSACISKGTINGTLTGQRISFGTVQGSSINFDGTIAGKTMNGSYKSGAQCGTDHGTWKASR